MLRRTEGIVLRTRPFGEADLIIDYLTRDFGVQGAFAKSPRKIKSRFGGSLEPFTHATISLLGKEETRLPRLTQSDIISPFQALREDVNAFLRAAGFAELALKLLPEREPNEKAFSLLLWAISALQAEPAGQLVPVVFKVRLLAASGYAPALAGCVKCAGPARKFSLADGALLCDRCGKPAPLRPSAGYIEPSPALLKIYGDLGSWPLDKVLRIKPSDRLLSEVKGFIEAHVREHIALNLKTERFGKENTPPI